METAVAKFAPAPLGSVSIVDFNEAYQKVMARFFAFPSGEMSLNDMSKYLGMSKTTAHSVVSKLAKEGFLKKAVLGKLWRITCNPTHIYNYSRKVAYNLMAIYESDILDEVRRHVPGVKSIILFGSYRKGDDNEESDIDIAAEVSGSRGLEIRELGTFQQFGYRKNVKVNLHIFSRKNININLFSNIANGIVLDGFLEVVP